MQDWAANPEKDRIDRENEDAEKEKKLEEEDEETIQRMRAMDDWKDGGFSLNFVVFMAYSTQRFKLIRPCGISGVS